MKSSSSIPVRTTAPPISAEELGARVFHWAWQRRLRSGTQRLLRSCDRGEWLFWMDSDDTIDEAECGRKPARTWRMARIRTRTSTGLRPSASALSRRDARMGRDRLSITRSWFVIAPTCGSSIPYSRATRCPPSAVRGGDDCGLQTSTLFTPGSDRTHRGPPAGKFERDSPAARDLELADRPGPSVCAVQPRNDVCRRATSMRKQLPVPAAVVSQFRHPKDSHVRKAYALLVSSLHADREIRRSHTSRRAEAGPRGARPVPDDEAELLFRQRRARCTTSAACVTRSGRIASYRSSHQ